MVTFFYRCPTTGAQVEGQHVESGPSPPGPLMTYVAVPCPACRGLHIVNPETGKLISEEMAPSSAPLCLPATPVHAG